MLVVLGSPFHVKEVEPVKKTSSAFCIAKLEYWNPYPFWPNSK
jgi:hypothetical protein